MGNFKDITGLRFGRLTVIKRVENSSSHHPRWLCKCDCGNEIITRSDALKEGRTQSCGCRYHHGLKSHPLYKVWMNIKIRCANLKTRAYKNYGGRGITICNDWNDNFTHFYEWSISHGWKDGLQIDRIDNDKGYYPDNCHFVTCKKNVRNRRNTVKLPNGQSLADACESIGIVVCVGKEITNDYRNIKHTFLRHGKLHPMFIDSCVERHVCPHRFLLRETSTDF